MRFNSGFKGLINSNDTACSNGTSVQLQLQTHRSGEKSLVKRIGVFFKFHEIDKVKYLPIIGKKKIFPQYHHEYKINVQITVPQNTLWCVIKQTTKEYKH